MSHKARLLAIAAFCVLTLVAFFPCAGEAAKKQTPPPDGALKPSEVVWSQENGALSVTLSAINELNTFSGVALAVTVCLYQLSDLSKFSALSSTFDGVEQLLAGDMDLLGGAAQMSRVEHIQPGEKKTLAFDRMEGSKYFAAVAGYANRDPAKCAAVAPFPVNETVIKLTRRKKAVYYTAGPLAAVVRLGADAVTINGGEDGSEQ